MDKIKIKDAALEQGMKPEELVARLREAGIQDGDTVNIYGVEFDYTE